MEDEESRKVFESGREGVGENPPFDVILLSGV